MEEKYTLDKEHWPDGPWKDEPDEVSWVDQNSGFLCLIRRAPMSGHLNGYVGVVPSDALYRISAYTTLYDGDNKEFLPEGRDVLDLNLKVHGGVTWSNKLSEVSTSIWWFGFDTAHHLDRVPLSPDFHLREKLKELGKDDSSIPSFEIPGAQYRDIEYVRGQVCDLAEQIWEISKLYEKVVRSKMDSDLLMTEVK